MKQKKAIKKFMLICNFDVDNSDIKSANKKDTNNINIKVADNSGKVNADKDVKNSPN